MKIDVNKLVSEEEFEVSFKRNVEINDEDLNKCGILRIENTICEGKIYKLDNNIFNINCKVFGSMYVPCDLSLEEVKHDFCSTINENIDLNDEKNEKNVQFDGKALDIFPFVWENIVLEKPSHVVKKNAKIKTKGDGWSLVDEEVHTSNQLSDLKEILDMEEER